MKTINIDENKMLFLDENEMEKIKLNLELLHLDSKKILVSSSLKGEGKTSVALGLSIFMAKCGAKVLYAASEYPEILGVDFQNEDGLTTSLGNLHIIIGSDFRKIEEKSEDYDYVIIDSKALSVSNESITYANMCDLILLVIEANRIDYKKALESKNMLTLGKCKEIRVVLNRTRKTYGMFRRKVKSLEK